MQRIAFFVLTNIAVVAILAVVMSVFGLEGYLDESGTGINFTGLLIFSAVIGFAGSFISLAISKWSAKRATGAQVISQPNNEMESWLLNTVERQARMAGIDCPEVAVYDAPDINAFATGARRNSALVAVSTGLLRGLKKSEVEAVLAHEVSHVANGDMITMALMQGVVNTFVIFLSRIIGFFVDRVILRNQRGVGLGFYVSSIAAQIVLGFLASIVVMWYSRRREFRADAGGAELAGRQGMIGALEALQRAHQPSALPKSMRAFGISSSTAPGIRRLFMSHPPLEERIKALAEAH